MKFLVVLSLFLFYTVESQSDGVVHDTIFLKPDGKVNIYKKTMGENTCTFTYQVQGGTQEEWHVEMQQGGEHLMCLVERGKVSYLYFEMFSMALTGPGVSVHEYTAIDTESTKVSDSACHLDRKTNTVSSVKGKFNNHLDKITIYATVGKTEL